MTGKAPALLFSVLAACASPKTEPKRDAGPLEAVPRVAEAPEPIDAAAPSLDAAAAPPMNAGDALRTGRALVQQERWRDALVALDQAAVGGDPTALAELAFAATLAGDDLRVEAAARAVADRADATEPVRATAYYHLGRAAELRGDLDAARAAYQQSLAIRASASVADRLRRLAARPALPQPTAPPCAEPRPTAEVCACLAGALAPRGTKPQCVASHRHGGDAWALTVVARDRAPTFLVAGAGQSSARVLAALGDADLTISRWSVLRGPDGGALIRVDASTATRADALLCVTGVAPRCLAVLPVAERVGTPATTRHLDLALDVTDERGVARVTLIDGAPSPADVLGAHRLW